MEEVIVSYFHTETFYNCSKNRYCKRALKKPIFPRKFCFNFKLKNATVKPQNSPVEGDHDSNKPGSSIGRQWDLVFRWVDVVNVTGVLAKRTTFHLEPFY